MVSNGGGQFIPAGTVDLHKLSLLLASLVAHVRATKDNHTHHTGKERPPNTTEDQYYIRPMLIVGTVHNPRQGGINSFPL